MKGPPSFRLIRTSMALRSVLVALASLLLAACGGGGGSSQNSNPNVTMSVSPQTLSVSVTTAQAAPAAGIQVNVAGLRSGQEVYLGVQNSDQGINRVINNGGTLPATITIQFDSPAILGPGTYDDTVQVEVCFDQACTQPLANSPQTVQVKYTVTMAPYVITALSPSSVLSGRPAFTLTVKGSTFTPQSTVLWNGVSQPTTYASATQLTAQISAAEIATPGNTSVAVSDPTYGTTNSETFTIQQFAITGLGPSSALAGGLSFTLTVTGLAFTTQSTVFWNGVSQPTTYASATQLTAQISAAEIATPGSASVTVSDPVNGTTNSETFTIQRPPLALNTVSPTSVTVGEPAFTLTVLGTGYSVASVVQWNGATLPTTYVSDTELLAQIPAADISATGTASVTVNDPTNSPTVTTAQTVTIVSASIDAVTFRMNPAHTGAVTFASVSFPGSSKWSVDFVDPPSYALIADGKVIVTVPLLGFTSEMLALDQATGNTVWGPIPLNGFSDATYDNGRVFVVYAPINSTSTLEAFDVNTGVPDWSTPVPSVEFASIAAPTAADGIVYVGGYNNIGALYALDESTGALLWTQPVQYGDNSAPAVTADGVYVSYPCQTYDFRPATGETIWHIDTGCAALGGGTPAVANQLLYSPDWQTGDTGDVFNAETGALKGSYATNSMPAFTTTMGYFLQSGTLRGVTLANNTVQWSFTGDGQLTGAPIVVNQYVFIGSSSGNLYALDGTTGTQVWNVNLGTSVGYLAAGDGLLVVPSGTTVTAYVLSTNP